MEQESIVTYELAAKSEISKERVGEETSELITTRRNALPTETDTQILRESRTIPEMPKQNAFAPSHILSDNSVSNKQSPKNTYLGMPIPSLSQLDEKTENPLLQLEGRFHHDLHLEQKKKSEEHSALKMVQTKAEQTKNL